MPAFIISADEIKETLPGYNPARSDEFHRQSTRLADEQYAKMVKSPDYKKVILLSGGSASGKTEYMSAYLNDRDAIIFDGTLPSIEGFKIKHKKALKCNKVLEVHAVIPYSFERAYIAFLARERKFDEKHFYRTHSQSRVTLLSIAREYPDTRITIVESKVEKDNSMIFTHFEFHKTKELVDYLQDIQYSEDEIVKIILRDPSTRSVTPRQAGSGS
jgi:hypothetical protein